MAIEAVQQILRDIPAASAVPQLSLTRRDRELQMEEGQPPMEVACAEQEALRWQRNEDLREKWKKRKGERNLERKASQDENPGGNLEEDPGAEDVARITLPGSMQGSTELQQNIELPEEDSTGTLFDDRS